MSTGERSGWWKSPRALLRTILQLDDTPHSIAMGTAVGMWIGMTPTVGIQMVLVMLFAFLTRPLRFRFNLIAALVTVYISNPLTMIPIYWFDYSVGTWFIEGNVTRDHFTRIMQSEHIQDSWMAVLTLLMDLGWPLVVGSLIVASVCSLITYPAIRILIHWFRGATPHANDQIKAHSENFSTGDAHGSRASGNEQQTHAQRLTDHERETATIQPIS